MSTAQERSNDDVLHHHAGDFQADIVENFTIPAENLDDDAADVVNFVKDPECGELEEVVIVADLAGEYANAPAWIPSKATTPPIWGLFKRLVRAQQRKARAERLGRMAALRRLAAQQRARAKSDQVVKATARRSSRSRRSQPVRTARRAGGRKAAAKGGGSGGGSGDGGRLAREFAAGLRLINNGASVMGG